MILATCHHHPILIMRTSYDDHHIITRGCSHIVIYERGGLKPKDDASSPQDHGTIHSSDKLKIDGRTRMERIITFIFSTPTRVNMDKLNVWRSRQAKSLLGCKDQSRRLFLDLFQVCDDFLEHLCLNSPFVRPSARQFYSNCTAF